MQKKGVRTKRKLAAALKALLETKTLDKIRIHDLTDLCDIHRQTFYYHFEDVYALFAWSAAEDGAELAKRLAAAPNWQAALEELLAFIRENRGYALTLLDQPPDQQVFWEQILPAAAQGNERLSMVLLPLMEKWIRDGLEPQNLIALLEALTTGIPG